MGFAELWESLLPLGRDPGTGGYRRYSFTPADAACRQWFTEAAARRGLRTEQDRNGNLWAWWDAGGASPGGHSAPQGHPGPRWPGAPRSAVVTGSHLDSVPDGGAFDGALGVVSGLAAIDLLRERGFAPGRPVGVAAFCEEEGARFGVACLGSRLLAGAVDPAAVRGLRDGDGVTLAAAMASAGLDPDGIGPDHDLLARAGAFVELHIEQGSALDSLGAAVGIAEGIWPHARWRLDFAGRCDHAGTTTLADRRDPMLPYAATVLAARQAAADHVALATIGKVTAEPGGANAISSAVRCWLDVRAPGQAALDRMTAAIHAAARRAAAAEQVSVSIRQESATPPVTFDPALRARIARTLGARGIAAPELATGAGHDAGVLAARLPAAMLFVRNPTGVSHSPAEQASVQDCENGIAALAAVIEDLAG